MVSNECAFDPTLHMQSSLPLWFFFTHMHNINMINL